LEKEITDFRQTREKEIQDQTKRIRDAIVTEIMAVVNDQVKTTNYDLVFDKSSDRGGRKAFRLISPSSPAIPSLCLRT